MSLAWSEEFEHWRDPARTRLIAHRIPIIICSSGYELLVNGQLYNYEILETFSHYLLLTLSAIQDSTTSAFHMN